MRKAAIITLNGYFNYGNRLQNYALQEVLKSLGFEVETIITDRVSKLPYIQRAKRLLRYPPREICAKICHKILAQFNKDEPNPLEEKREEIFKQFTLNHIKETDYCISGVDIPEDLSYRYDYFVTGSDQVWNPSFLGGAGSIFFLQFAEQHKRIAYAPSFGVSTIPDEHKEQFREWIAGIHKISVREDDGARIIKELTGIEAPVLVDPTLLLTREKWISIAKEADSKPKGKYLLSFFLGEVPVNYKTQIQNIAKKNNLEIVHLGDINNGETYLTGPDEFIDFIDSCSMLCTDSFHGVVFSIIMEKPFIAFERIGPLPYMFSRINSLLNKFGLSSRKAKNNKVFAEAMHLDFSHVPALLEVEREKALNYLTEALSRTHAK